MRAVVQRVTSSKVVVDGKIVGSINKKYERDILYKTRWNCNN